MRTSSSCPECSNALSANARRCSCGWLKPIPQSSSNADFRCWYNIHGRRCPLPGTISPNRQNSWYCRRHYRTLDDPRLGEAELRYIEENYQKIIAEEYTDWRKNLNQL